MKDATEAVRDALADYLNATLTAAPYPYVADDLKVWRDWPAPGHKIKKFAVSVLDIGSVQERMYPPVVISSVIAGDNTTTVTYSYGVIDLQLQLDGWATTASGRDQLASHLRDALNRPPNETVPGAPYAPKFKRASGLVIPLPGLLGVLCEFRFKPTPNPAETSIAAETGEWRATWQGVATFHIPDQETLARIKRITMTIGADNGAEEIKIVP